MEIYFVVLFKIRYLKTFGLISQLLTSISLNEVISNTYKTAKRPVNTFTKSHKLNHYDTIYRVFLYCKLWKEIINKQLLKA